jgi:hypothetical protein
VPAIGRVEFTPVDQMRNGLTVVSTTVSETLDASGGLSIRLAATTDPATRDVGVTYRVVERIVGQPIRTYYVSVPHDQGATLQLADLPASPPVAARPGSRCAPPGTTTTRPPPPTARSSPGMGRRGSSTPKRSSAVPVARGVQRERVDRRGVDLRVGVGCAAHRLRPHRNRRLGPG